MKQKRSMSLRARIFTLTLLSFFTLATYLFVFCYRYFVSTIHMKLLDSANADVTYTSEKIDQTLESGLDMAEWIYYNDDLYSSIKNYNADDPQTVHAFIQNVDKIQQQIRFMPIGSDISFVLVHGASGCELLYSTRNDITSASIMSAPWFPGVASDQDNQFWKQVFPLPAKTGSRAYIIPVFVSIYGSNSNTPAGWGLIGFSDDMITDVYKSGISTKRDIRVINAKGVCISSTDMNQLGTEIVGPDIQQRITRQQSGSFKMTRNGKQYEVVFRTSTQSGLTTMDYVPMDVLSNEISLFIGYILLVLLVGLALYIPITVFWTGSITRPIKILLARMKKIAMGDFRYDPSIEFRDELGELGKGINTMAASISSLLRNQAMQEKKKREMEIQVLQAQINPHFLYNTLNIVRWMAIAQHADGISETIGALSRLMRHLATGTDQLISLRDECAIVRDYMSIQEIRYSGRLSLDNRIPEELQTVRIVKFTLQPIIENAIFHGIEPKVSAGTIRLTAERAESDVYIHVRDDGIGMSRETIDGVLSGKIRSCRSLNGIGIRNVDERIRLTYGDAFGLSIESRENEFTDVCIHIPYEV